MDALRLMLARGVEHGRVHRGCTLTGCYSGHEGRRRRIAPANGVWNVVKISGPGKMPGQSAAIFRNGLGPRR